MPIVDPHFTMPGQDMPPQEFKDLKTQQGQINWLAQFAMRINNSFEGQWDATAESLPYTDEASVSVIPSDDGLTFNFGIPRGAPYDDQVAFAFDTVEQMQENADNLGAGMLVLTAGFYTVGDGGGAFYQISDSGTANGMDVIECGSLRANLVEKETHNVKKYGAHANGVDDDTAIIQHVINAINSGEKIYLPTSNGECYRITNTLTIPVSKAYAAIYSDTSTINWQTKGIKFDPVSDDENVILFDVKASGICFESLTMSCSKTDFGIGINSNLETGSDTDVSIHRCIFTRFNKCINHYNRGLWVTNTLLAACNIGIVINKDSKITNTGNNTQRFITINNNRFHDINTAVKLANSSINGLQLINNVLDVAHNVTNGNTLLTGDSSNETGSNFEISNNYILDAGEYVIYLDFEVQGFILANNIFTNKLRKAQENYLYALSLNRAVISSNIFTNSGKSSIKIGSLTNTIITENSFNFSGSNASSSEHYGSIEITRHIELCSINNNTFGLFNSANGRCIIYSGTDEITYSRITENISRRSEIFTNVNNASVSNSVIQASNIT